MCAAVADTFVGQLTIVGEPGPDIEVVAYDAIARCRTAADGSFVLPLPPLATKRTALYFVHHGVAFGMTAVDTGRGGTTQLGRIDLAPLRVSLRCVDGAGLPVAATVRTFASLGDLVRVAIPMPDGSLDDLLWDPFRASSFDVAFANGEVQQVEVDASTAMPIVVRQRPTGTLRVRLLDRDGVPRPGVVIAVEPWGRTGAAPDDPATFHAQRAASPWHDRRTDAAGTLQVRGVLAGPVLVYATDAWGTFAYGPKLPPDRQPRADGIVDIRAGEEAAIDLVLRQ